jgi:hypothetical protein
MIPHKRTEISDGMTISGPEITGGVGAVVVVVGVIVI